MNRVNAFRHFAEFDGRTQSQQHIKPLHDYVTSRLVLEGGFHPWTSSWSRTASALFSRFRAKE